MQKNATKPYCIVGYSLDSAYLARQLANSGYRVEFYSTGELGYPYDDINEYFSYEDCIKMKASGIDVQYESLNNSTYAFIPFNELKMVNSKNGLISYPLNRSSFESAEEREQIESLLGNLGAFHKTLEKSTNPLNEYKNFFPKWLYDSLLKHLGLNKWGNLKQNKFTIPAIAKEINISALDGNNTGAVYRPVDGFQSLCKKLLDHPNIKYGTYPIEKLNSLITKPNRTCEIILMDNRIDYACKYSQGVFDRIEWSVESSKEPIIEEFIDIDDGIVFTPHKEYWCITNKHGNIQKIKSKLIDDIQYSKQSMIAPTIHNQKAYLAYSKMMSLYSGKILKLGNSFYTTIT